MAKEPGKERPRDQKSAENERYRERAFSAGLLKLTLMVPAMRIPELRATVLEWRREAKLLLDTDLPSADQILQIHGVCRTLNLKLPVEAFATRITAASWLQQERKLGKLRVHLPQNRG